MSRAAVALAGLVLAIAGTVGGFMAGNEYGHGKEVARRDAQAAQDLTAIIAANKSLAADAAKASKALRAAAATRAAQDAATTKEFKDALAQSAGDRAGCVFPPDVMRQLTAARDRAAEAATRGLRAAVPAAAGSGQQQGR